MPITSFDDDQGQIVRRWYAAGKLAHCILNSGDDVLRVAGVVCLDDLLQTPTFERLALGIGHVGYTIGVQHQDITRPHAHGPIV